MKGVPVKASVLSRIASRWLSAVCLCTVCSSRTNAFSATVASPQRAMPSARGLPRYSLSRRSNACFAWSLSSRSGGDSTVDARSSASVPWSMRTERTSALSELSRASDASDCSAPRPFSRSVESNSSAVFLAHSSAFCVARVRNANDAIQITAANATTTRRMLLPRSSKNVFADSIMWASSFSFSS